MSERMSEERLRERAEEALCRLTLRNPNGGFLEIRQYIDALRADLAHEIAERDRLSLDNSELRSTVERLEQDLAAAESERDELAKRLATARGDALANLTNDEMKLACLGLERALPRGHAWTKGEVHQIWVILSANRSLSLSTLQSTETETK